MSEQMSLGDILSDEKPAAPAAPAEPAKPEAPPAPASEVKDPVEKQQTERNTSNRKKWADKEQAAQGRVRDPETGQFLKADEKPEDPEKAASKPEPKAEAKPAAPAEPAKPAAPQQEFTEKEKAFLRAAQEERQKRQALEARLKELEGGKPQEPAKTFWDDPEGALKRQQAEVQQAIVGTRLQTSEAIARSRHADFDEKVAIFSELAKTAPGLAQQMLTAADPAEFVYRTATNHKAIQEAGGLEQMRAKIEAETEVKLRAKLEAELHAKAEALAKDRAAIPPSLSEARSTGAANRPVWSGPPSLDDILKS